MASLRQFIVKSVTTDRNAAGPIGFASWGRRPATRVWGGDLAVVRAGHCLPLVPAREPGVQVLGETSGQALSVLTSQHSERRSWAIVWRASFELPPDALCFCGGGLRRPPPPQQTFPEAGRRAQAPASSSAG